MGSKYVFDKFLEEPDQKDSVESAKYKIIFSSSSFTLVFGFFFHESGSGFSGSDPDFWPIRIRTQEKKSDPDPEENPDPKH